MRDGRPAFVTCLGATDTPGGWRPGKAEGGVLVDVAVGRVVLRGLSMPHSPRWHDGRLWLLNSGTGELIVADPAAGRGDVVCALPAYLRGLAFAGPFALVGLCKVRERHIFGNLPVQSRHADLTCGVAAIDLRTGRPLGVLTFTSGCTEVYDVRVVPGTRRAMALNLERPEARQAFPAPEFSYWLRPSNERPVEEPPTVGSSPPHSGKTG